MVTAAPHTVELDDYLRDMIRAVYSAVDTARPHLADDPKRVDQAIEDSEEVLGTIMAGKVDEWLE
ncbi:MAG: hypothetical protein HW416_514 [Chloroflexi bacterium]|nr:hypothetical protein [Chloroflexota bacterium]